MAQMRVGAPELLVQKAHGDAVDSADMTHCGIASESADLDHGLIVLMEVQFGLPLVCWFSEESFLSFELLPFFPLPFRLGFLRASG